MRSTLLALSLLALLLPHPAQSQEEKPAEAPEEQVLVDTDDQSGTNPINFTFDARIYNEHLWLNVPGDAYQNVTTFEFRAPIADGKWQMRAKLRAVDLDIDRAGISEFGFGDMDLRFLTVPILIPEKKFAIAVGAEFFIPTGSDDLLSSNAFTIGPQIFFGFFGVFNWIDLIAPGYQHRFSVYEESGVGDVHTGIIDLFILKTFNDKQQWVMLNPQTILDYEEQTQYIQFDAEFGTMLDNFIEPNGHSVYLRPTLGILGDRPNKYGIEFGYKIIW